MYFKHRIVTTKLKRDSDRYLQTTQMARLSSVIAEMEYEAKYRAKAADEPTDLV